MGITLTPPGLYFPAESPESLGWQTQLWGTSDPDPRPLLPSSEPSLPNPTRVGNSIPAWLFPRDDNEAHHSGPQENARGQQENQA